MSFSRLVDEARYQVACDLLTAPDTRIAEVAFATGYENPSHFSRAFRRIAGVAPSDFQKCLGPQT